MEQARLIITGHDADGASIVVADESPAVHALCGDRVTARFIWARDDTARFPDAGDAPVVAAGMPPPGGFNFSTLTIRAGASDEYHGFIAQNLGDCADKAQPGFHRTPTLDLIVVIAGELVLELDNSQARTLRAGDSAVLNGVRHRWSNRSGEDATIAAVMIGALGA